MLLVANDYLYWLGLAKGQCLSKKNSSFHPKISHVVRDQGMLGILPQPYIGIGAEVYAPLTRVLTSGDKKF